MRRLPSRRTLDGALRWIITSWKAAVGVAGGLAVILGLVFHPPWGGSSSSSASDTKTKTTTQACPGISKGRISNVKADPPIPLSAYWKLNPGSRVPASKERLNAIGRVVHFNVDINGYRGKQLTVWWWMLTANGEPLPERTGVGGGASVPGGMENESEDDSQAACNADRCFPGRGDPAQRVVQGCAAAQESEARRRAVSEREADGCCAACC